MSRRHRYLAVIMLTLVVPLTGCNVSTTSGSKPDKSASPSPSSVGQSHFAGAEFRDANFGFTFHYPVTFRPGHLETLAAQKGKPVAVAVLQLDPLNLLILQKYEVKVVIPRKPLDPAVLAQVDAVVSGLIGHSASGESVDVAGLPGARYDNIDVSTPPNGQSRLFFFFDGMTEYELNCQSTPATRQVVNSACDEVVASMKTT